MNMRKTTGIAIAILLITSVYVLALLAPAYAPGNPPVANAGPDQTVDEDALVVLDGSGSSDPDGDPLTFSWTQTPGPTVTLFNPNTANPTFIAPLVNTQTVLTFQLIVNDGTLNSTADTVNITVNPVFIFRTDRFNKTTAPAPASQTISGLGFQPKALILFSNGAPLGALQEQYNFAIGFSNLTYSRSFGIHSDDDSILSQTGRAWGTKVLRLLSNGLPTVSAEASVTSFNSDGFTLNWSTNDASATKIHYIALGGPALTNVGVNHFVANTVNGTQSVTGIGFQPDFVMFLNPRSTSGNGDATHAFGGLGFAKSATQRGAMAFLSEDFSDPMDTYRWQKTNRTILSLTPSTGAINAEADFVSMNTDGFTVDWIDSPNNADRIYYLALKGGRYDVGSFNQKNSTGNQAITGVGFQTKGVILASIGEPTNASVQTHNRISFGVADVVGAGHEGTVWTGDKDATPESWTARATLETKAHRTLIESDIASFSTVTGAADLLSFDSDGFTLDWTTSDGSPREIIYVAFDPPSGSPPSWMEDVEVTTGIFSNSKQIESHLAVKSGNSASNDIVVASMIEGSRCVTYRSTNGSASWPDTDRREFTNTTWADAGCSDPVLAIDSTGKFYFVAMGLRSDTRDSIRYTTSTDGINWATATDVEVPPVNVTFDKPWVAIDKNPSSLFKDTAYVCWRERNNNDDSRRILIERPTVAGDTPKELAKVTNGSNDNFLQGCYVAVGPVQNEVYVTWVHYKSSTSADIYLTRNDNGGAPNDWKTPRVIATITRLSTCNGAFNNGSVTGIGGIGCIQADIYPRMIADFRTFTGIHIVYTHLNGLTNKADIFYKQSYNCYKNTDFASCTFSPSGAGLRLNSVGDRDQWEPAITSRKTAENPEGNIHVTARDRRDDTNNINWEQWHYHCHTTQFGGCGGTGDWHGPNNQKQVSDSAMNNEGDPITGDYSGIASSANREAYTVFLFVRPPNPPVQLNPDLDILSDKTDRS